MQARITAAAKAAFRNISESAQTPSFAALQVHLSVPTSRKHSGNKRWLLDSISASVRLSTYYDTFAPGPRQRIMELLEESSSWEQSLRLESE
ncbi:hypothetical protein LTR37_005552 [Vermiconidia calcicola]|uniref:Uncharacterized protein n=1 Tax=Vermiconidia calcicola TaxID=1690605 RepID=A0ACC3NJ29_9PEZI|nr:hypothetical protein LTR37_005552 [Vermiconidia calcicola]